MSDSVLILVFSGALIGIIAGFVMHRSDFCIAGMFRDIFMFRSFFKMRSLVLAAAAAMLLFEIGRVAGLLPLYPFPLLPQASAAGMAGGFLFGIGMVLAGGCVVGTLYKMGSGSVLSAVAFTGLIFGSTLYAGMHDWWKQMLAATTLFSGSKTIPAHTGISPSFFVTVSLAFLSFLIWRWFRKGEMTRKTASKGGMQPWHAAVILAFLSFASYYLIGMPMGITTSYSKAGAMIISLFAPEYIRSFSFFTAAPLSYTNPFTGCHLTGGAGASFDGISVVQFPLIAGITAGGFISAVSAGEFRLFFRIPLRQYISSAAGGVIMGLAARMAPACNVWHIFGGLPVFAYSSILFVLSMLPGAYIGGKLLERWVIR